MGCIRLALGAGADGVGRGVVPTPAMHTCPAMKAFAHKDTDEAPDDVFMKKFTRSDAERFEYLHWQVFSGMSCTDADASRRNLFALQKAAIREAKGLAQSEPDRKILEGMLIGAASNWLAATDNFQETYLRPLENLPVNVRKELE